MVYRNRVRGLGRGRFCYVKVSFRIRNRGWERVRDSVSSSSSCCRCRHHILLGATLGGVRWLISHWNYLVLKVSMLFAATVLSSSLFQSIIVWTKKGVDIVLLGSLEC